MSLNDSIAKKLLRDDQIVIMKRKKSCSLLVAVALFCGMMVFVLVTRSRGIRWWEFGYYEKPLWSPDGKKVMYLFSKEPADYPNLTVMEIEKFSFLSRVQNIELPTRYLSSPAWRSHDEVSVFSERVSDSGTNLTVEPATLYLYDITTKTWEAFEAPLPIAAGIAWHPDGSYALVSLRGYIPLNSGKTQGGIYKFTPSSKQFELWIEAELPGSIAWSPDGNRVAFLDFVSVGNENPVHLNVVEVATREQVVAEQLSMESEARSWSIVGDAGLSWSTSSDQIVANGTMIEYRNQRDYDVHNGFFFIPVEEPEQFSFWGLSRKPIHFDVSPSGEEIVFTAVTQRFIVKNSLLIVRVPEQFR